MFTSLYKLLLSYFISFVSSQQILPASEYTRETGIQLDPFYTKYLNANGMPILSSHLVPDSSLLEASYWIQIMMRELTPLMRTNLKERNVREVVMAKSEVITDVPEYKDLTDLNWARGLGATNAIPVTSSAEENIQRLGEGNDVYFNECLLIHEFGHTVWDMAIAKARPDLQDRLERTFIKNRAKYEGFYAATNFHEYWGEGTQTWFNCNDDRQPLDEFGNPVKTAAQLKRFDPELADLLKIAYGDHVPTYDIRNMATSNSTTTTTSTSTTSSSSSSSSTTTTTITTTATTTTTSSTTSTTSSSSTHTSTSSSITSSDSSSSSTSSSTTQSTTQTTTTTTGTTTSSSTRDTITIVPSTTTTTTSCTSTLPTIVSASLTRSCLATIGVTASSLDRSDVVTHHGNSIFSLILSLFVLNI